MTTAPRIDAQPLLPVDVDTGDDTAPPRLMLAGDVEMADAERLREAVGTLLHDGDPERIDVDLRGVTFLDSGGIRALLMCHADARRAGCEMRLTRPPRNILLVLQMTGLVEHFGLTEASA